MFYITLTEQVGTRVPDWGVGNWPSRSLAQRLGRSPDPGGKPRDHGQRRHWATLLLGTPNAQRRCRAPLWQKCARLPAESSIAEEGGDGWESNPPRPVERPATGFEDRGAHRDPTTPDEGQGYPIQSRGTRSSGRVRRLRPHEAPSLAPNAAYPSRAAIPATMPLWSSSPASATSPPPPDRASAASPPTMAPLTARRALDTRCLPACPSGLRTIALLLA
jgi:hypothetical protein